MTATKISPDTLLRVTRERRPDGGGDWQGAALFLIAPMRNICDLLDLHPEAMRRVVIELESGAPISFTYVNRGGLTRTRFVIEIQKGDVR